MSTPTQIKIFPGYTAKQWCLFTTDCDTDQPVEGIEQVAERMNEIVNEEFANPEHNDPYSLMDTIGERWWEFEHHGACDTEPRAQLYHLVEGLCMIKGWNL